MNQYVAKWWSYQTMYVRSKLTKTSKTEIWTNKHWKQLFQFPQRSNWRMSLLSIVGSDHAQVQIFLFLHPRTKFRETVSWKTVKMGRNSQIQSTCTLFEVLLQNGCPRKQGEFERLWCGFISRQNLWFYWTFRELGNDCKSPKRQSVLWWFLIWQIPILRQSHWLTRKNLST